MPLSSRRSARGEIGTGAELARRFGAMVRDRVADALAQWLEDARGGPFAGFAEGLRRDRAAVEAALALPWSTGPVEGKITKLKLVTRSMCSASITVSARIAAPVWSEEGAVASSDMLASGDGPWRGG